MTKCAGFRDLVLPHLDAAYNLARWLSGSRADADDIVQEAMLRALRAFPSLRNTDDAKPWLLAIVRNCHRSRAGEAHRRRMVALDEAAKLASSEPGPEDEAMGSSDRRRLNGLIAALPEEFREVLILREIEDLSYREIAVVAGCPIGTVMSRLARARAVLRQGWLDKEGAADHGLS